MSAEAKVVGHTPGPWTIGNDGQIDGGGGTVVQPYAIDWAPDRRLIRAAPELLDALGKNRTDGDGVIGALWWALDMVNMYEARLIELGDPREKVLPPSQLAGHTKARAALAKARAAIARATEG